MKKFLLIIGLATASILYSCGGADQNDATSNTPTDKTDAAAPKASGDNPSYDPERGEGKFTNVDIPATVDPVMAAAGEKVSNVKCSSCHKLSEEKLVGPGWKNVTQRHKPEWIMNFITNPDEMIDKDPKAQAMLELCMVRMPNQNLSDTDARALYEFMRKNDGVK